MKSAKIKIKKLDSKAIIPHYQTSGSAGFDLCSIEDAIIKANSQCVVGTGLAFEIESGFEVQIRPRSGLAFKHSITLTNSPGTIDSDYRGEIKIILFNLSDTDYEVKCGDRVAQGVLQEVIYASFEEIEELEHSSRGEGGFGSTGKN